MTLVMKSKFGSALYGTSTPTSDVDYKGIFIPDAKSIVMGNLVNSIQNNTSGDNTKNTANDVDEELYSLKKFIGLALTGETIALDMLHTPKDMIIPGDHIGVWEFIQSNRAKFYTTDMKAYLGYVKRQAAKYGIKGSRMDALRQVKEWADTLPISKPWAISDEKGGRLVNCSWVDGVMHAETKLGEYFDKAPAILDLAFIDGDYYSVLGSKYQSTLTVARFKTSIDKAWTLYGSRAREAAQNKGIDWKSLHHAIRGGLQLKEIYSTGDLIYPLKDAQLLLDIKLGKIEFAQVGELLEDLLNDVHNLSIEAGKNGMPQRADPVFWDDFIERVYLDQIKLEYKLCNQ